MFYSNNRIAVFGGTFDPPHIGHISAAKSVLKVCSVDKVLFVPCCQTWNKHPVASPEDRYDMVKASVMEMDGCDVSRMEVERGGMSYTSDTLIQVKSENPDSEIFMVVGSDVASQMNTWGKLGGIKEIAEIIVIERHGVSGLTMLEGWNFRHIKADIPNISSSQIRDMISKGISAEEFLPTGASDIINERKLYLQMCH